MEILSVGGKIEREATEGSRVSWDAERFEIFCCYRQPTPREVYGFREGRFEYALTTVQQMPFLSFQIIQPLRGQGFGQQAGPVAVLFPWQECPVHVSRIDPQHLPAIDDLRATPNLRFAVVVILADETLTIRALRLMTLSREFSLALVDALFGTAAAYTFESYPAGVERVFAEVPVGQIAAGAAMRCFGGD